jgi:hypothetical protein
MVWMAAGKLVNLREQISRLASGMSQTSKPSIYRS